jgi:hypothetical protein
MLSHRRRAQLGVASATLLLITTLTILYQGSHERGAVSSDDGNVRLVANQQASPRVVVPEAQVAALKR